MKAVICLQLVLLVPQLVHATEQEPDRLFYKGKLYTIYTHGEYIMEDYFKRYPQKRPTGEVEPGVLKRSTS